MLSAAVRRIKAPGDRTRAMSENKQKLDLPFWDLSPVYRGFDDHRYINDKEQLSHEFEKLEKVLSEKPSSGKSLEKYLENGLKQLGKSEELYENLYSYCYASYSVETSNPRTLRELNYLEKAKLRLYRAKAILRKNLAAAGKGVEEALSKNSFLADHSLFLNENRALGNHQLSEEMEDLIEELLQPGANAWSRLQEAVSSELSVKWDRKTGERKSVTELRALAFSPDRKTRKKAFRKEIKAWKNSEIPLAYALNGVKGFSLILNTRRKWNSPVEKSAFQSKVTEKTVKALTGAMEKSLPSFHRYLEAKAAALGLEKLAFYDLFAPIPAKTGEEHSSGSWTFTEAGKFIVNAFTSFSPEMGKFAETAFEKKWVDAMPRRGKVGGAYCINFPIKGESRILCNYNNSFSSLSTVAHELGHAWHSEVLKKESPLNRDYPMTLAETASIFSEILIFDTAIKTAKGWKKLQLMEIFLQELTQVIVDILSRFYFEKSLFKKRKEGELTPQELSMLMREAQKKTYGNAIERQTYHQYMWAVKGHYYIPGLSFYNYPYAFGQLFGIALYRKYLKDRKGFPEGYNEILKLSGRYSAVEIAEKVGADVEDQSFWLESLDYICELIDEFSEKVKQECKPDEC